MGDFKTDIEDAQFALYQDLEKNKKIMPNYLLNSIRDKFLNGFEKGWISAIKEPNNSSIDPTLKEYLEMNTSKELTENYYNLGYALGIIVGVLSNHPREVLHRIQSYQIFVRVLKANKPYYDFMLRRIQLWRLRWKLLINTEFKELQAPEKRAYFIFVKNYTRV